ncbi:MAG: hypothetical protein QF554_08055 [Dehalococcoidia bacterium]|jgi:hypothetical protein|nr:hypothetical protein [Dehalococcoidia bacterium]
MKFQISQMARFTGHRKMLVTLGVGAMALTVVACGSAAPGDDPLPENPPPAPAAVGQNDSGFAIGAIDGVGSIGGTQPAAGDASSSTDAAISGAVEGGAQGVAIAPGLPLDARFECEAGRSYPSTLYVEGEPVSVDPAMGVEVHDLPDSSVSISRDALAPEDAVPSVQINVEDGISIGMPVPGLADVPEMIVEPMEAPDPVSAPPSILPNPEQATTSTADALPELIAIATDDCDPSVGTSSSSGSTGTTIEPIEPTDNELPANIKVVEAPIESAGISVAESFPPQYMLWVVSGLSNGATTFGDYAVKRDGNIVAVSITNHVQRDVMATQVYGIHQSNIALGTEFVSGETYEVVINGRQWTQFTAQ